MAEDSERENPEIHEHIKEGFDAELLSHVDDSGIELIDRARQIATLLGFQYIDPAHIALAKLVADYQRLAPAKGKRYPRSPEAIIKMASPDTRTYPDTEEKTLKPSSATETLIRDTDKSRKRLKHDVPPPRSLYEKVPYSQSLMMEIGAGKNALAMAMKRVSVTDKTDNTVIKIREVLSVITSPQPLFGSQRSA